ncbi:PhzF family phenazine biosynthesis protein [Paramaledivibacter caminithermalis]|jgi:trans-2,3-dihydro-3-hydroxyanthranilate isomerase|uniref:Phenazine biosynthesis protein PhzF family n=1 Tax=Paramaledivibacter caminithermalis (strain DSM 15212 / CIP 107654 / DViRD3) TaxID=1121301 RepID=A0A1M6NYJ1_PARC5|nr:PhzF family phenazine biosynthesis protein [Paramaledivibacter caminithermalis]SHK00756.1 phenazine biosynthesis protein PhzF family [Paramaledivibacter caminithermalis DSM 15212]
MEKKFYQVDAFTNIPFGGNPAGVVLDADDLDENQMFNIAKEMALSETAFVKKAKGKEYDYEIRFFTPWKEIELCGHATIAAFFVLANKGLIESNSSKVLVKQKTLAGILPIEIYFKGNQVQRIIMTQKKPKHISTVDNIHEIANIMGISNSDIGIKGFKVLPMSYTTGLIDIILPVKNIDILKNINPDFEKLKEYNRNTNTIGVHAFTIKDYDKRVISCRNFAPAVGINEEAATGTSNGALCAYLINNGIIGIDERVDIVCEQGYFMKRPSQIYVEAIRDENDLVIKVGGKAVIVMEGRIFF